MKCKTAGTRKDKEVQKIQEVWDLHNWWGKTQETQQPQGDVVTNHHPLDYWVDHTTGTIIVDKQMRQRVWWGDTDWNPELVLEDILSLVEEE